MDITNSYETKELLQAQAQIWNYTFNYATAMALKCAVQLGIPDIIATHGKPITLSELATMLEIPESKRHHLYRVMRILVHANFFLEHQGEGYLPTPASKLLLKNHPRNLSLMLLLVTDPVIIKAMDSMTTFFQGTDPTPMDTAFGMGFLSYCSQHPDFHKLDMDAMATDAEFLMSVVVKDCKKIFEGSKLLIDVRGRRGIASKAISDAFPDIKCILYDHPDVVSNMKGSGNIEYVAGNMFESIPSGDTILLNWVLHDWNDEECLMILKGCRKAIGAKEEGGKVIMIDTIIGNEKENSEATQTQLCLDIVILSLVEGRERTETEWEQLFLEAGFMSYRTTPVLGLRSIIEVFP